MLGLRSLAELAAIDLGEVLWSGMPWSLRSELDRRLPEQVAIPTGRLARLDYSSGEPVLAVKLQELFGLKEGPRVLGGQLPVTVQLLSPAGRPVQITQDLAGFWQGSYAQVRQELRGRYPKHPWPEDPLNATPTAFTKRKAANSPPEQVAKAEVGEPFGNAGATLAPGQVGGRQPRQVGSQGRFGVGHHHSLEARFEHGQIV